MNRYEIQRDKAVIFIESLKYGMNEVLVDVWDLAKILRVSKSWRLQKSGYPLAICVDADGKERPIPLHKIIMVCPQGMEIDHINGNKLDNRKRNLRAVTHAENMQNVGAYKTGRSGLRNICWDKRASAWRVLLRMGKVTEKQYFYNRDDAIKAAAAMRKEFMPFSTS